GSITVYAVSRDMGGNFLANVATTNWSLLNKSGGVANGDLVAAADTKSATFTGHLVGTAAIHAGATGLTSVDSGTLAVVVGSATQVKVETAADGSGSVVGAQNVVTGNSVTNYAITRDAQGNFLANVAATAWSLPTKTSGVANGDLVAAVDSKSAIFTGHLVGTATVRATSGALTSVDSGTLTVVPSSPTRLVFTTAPQSLTAGVNSGTITVQVQDAQGNATNATARTVTLTSTASFGIFRNSTDASNITSIVISSTANSTNFLYKATLTGSPTIPAASSPLTSAMQVETVN